MILQWLLNLKINSSTDRPVFVGINGPQGSGKSFLAQGLVEKLFKQGLQSVTVSIDDFYLTRKEQIELAKRHPGNLYLQNRGYPGTHDTELGSKVLESLKQVNRSGSTECPVYDKSAHQGKGDRVPREKWKKILAPLDFVFFEGWMLGFSPVIEANELAKLDPSMREVNSFLEKYQPWNALYDGFIQIIPEQMSWVIDWRIEAEENMKALGKPGMSREEVTRFIHGFLPAYDLYFPRLLKHPPKALARLEIRIGRDRLF